MSSPWYTVAQSMIGLSETRGVVHNPKILEMYRLCGHGWVEDDETPWCAAFVGACLKLSGYANSGQLNARSYLGFGRPLDKPQHGCIAVFWRNGKNSVFGHVAFFDREEGGKIFILGGNQGGAGSDEVNIKSYPRKRLLGYFWPVDTAPLPDDTNLDTILDIAPAQAPAHLTGGAPASTAPEVQPAVPAGGGLARLHDGFGVCNAFVARWEGGFVNHKDDPGGATNMGITIGTLSQWLGRPASVQEVKDLSRNEADRIYRSRYYDISCGDNLPLPVAAVVYDAAVNSGPSRSAKWLQEAINDFGIRVDGVPVDVDGEIGPQTVAGALQCDPRQLAEAHVNERERFLRGLSTFKTFGKGWMNRLNALRSFIPTLPAIVHKPAEEKPAPAPLPEVTPATPAPAAPDTAILAAILAKLDELRAMIATHVAATGTEPQPQTGDKPMTNARDIKAVLEALDDAGLVKPGGIVDGLGGNAAALDRVAEVASLLRSDSDAGTKLGVLLETLTKAGVIKSGAGLTPVNAALGETVGKALDGKKTVIGIVALVASVFLPQLAPLTTFLTDTVVAGDGKMAVSTVQNVLTPLASLFTGWGALGKIDKWMHKPSVATIGSLLKRLGNG